MVKALIEWKRGRNEIMVVPSSSLDRDDFYKTYNEDIATSTKPTEYSFKGYKNKKLNKTCCIVYLIQPEIID